MPTSISLIALPFDSAHYKWRIGAGPLHIINNGLVKRIEALGNHVSYKEILHQKRSTELATSFELFRILREELTIALEKQFLPIVLSGNCSAVVPVIAGLSSNDVAIIWFDAHGDCETPETTTSGFLDGMGMSMLLNRSWHNLLSRYHLTTSMTGENIVLVGARDLSRHEKQVIAANEIRYISVEEIKRSNISSIKTICKELLDKDLNKIHLHIDVDVIDPLVAPSNSYAVENGLNRNELFTAITSCLSKHQLTSMTIASYDPAFDTDNEMLRIIHELITTIVEQYNLKNG